MVTLVRQVSQHIAATSMPPCLRLRPHPDLPPQGGRGAGRGSQNRCGRRPSRHPLLVLSLRESISHNEKSRIASDPIRGQHACCPLTLTAPPSSCLGDDRCPVRRRSLAHALHTLHQENTAQRGLASQEHRPEQGWLSTREHGMHCAQRGGT